MSLKPRLLLNGHRFCWSWNTWNRNDCFFVFSHLSLTLLTDVISLHRVPVKKKKNTIALAILAQLCMFALVSPARHVMAVLLESQALQCGENQCCLGWVLGLVGILCFFAGVGIHVTPSACLRFLPVSESALEPSTGDALRLFLTRIPLSKFLLLLFLIRFPVQKSTSSVPASFCCITFLIIMWSFDGAQLSQLLAQFMSSSHPLSNLFVRA